MPQTTQSVPMSCARIDISILPDCSVWTNISGSTQSVQNTTQTKAVGEEYTLDGIGAIVEVGKIEPFDLTVRIAFTNVATEAYPIVRAAFNTAACQGKVCVRWIPSGVVGGEVFATNYAPITSFDWPPVDASTAGPIFTNFVIRVSLIDRSVFVS